MKRLLAAAGIAFIMTAAGCAQEEGDRCERSADCEEGLICCIRLGEQEGTCQKEENCTLTKKAAPAAQSLEECDE